MALADVEEMTPGTAVQVRHHPFSMPLPNPVVTRLDFDVKKSETGDVDAVRGRPALHGLERTAGPSAPRQLDERVLANTALDPRLPRRPLPPHRRSQGSVVFCLVFLS